MLTQDYLMLRLVRLKSAEESEIKGDGLIFIFPKGGAGRYVLGAGVHHLLPGDVFVANGSAKGKVTVSNKSEMAFWSFALNLEHLFPLFATNEISLIQDVAERFKTPRTYPSSSALARECHRLISEVPPQFNLDHRSQLLRAAAAVLTVEFQTARPQRVGFVRAEEHMIQVFERLSSAELLSSSVGELAEKFGCSRRHLNRLFHQHFGVSVAALRMEMRLIKAVSLLRDPNAKVIRVAEECGFNHLGLFNTCFKRRFGTSPGQWRKINSQAKTEPTDIPGSPIDSSAICPLRVTGICPWSGKADHGDEKQRRGAHARRAVPSKSIMGAAGVNASAGEQAIAIQKEIPQQVLPDRVSTILRTTDPVQGTGMMR
jgi:AraC-like DNA-binding protein